MQNTLAFLMLVPLLAAAIFWRRIGTAIGSYVVATAALLFLGLLITKDPNGNPGAYLTGATALTLGGVLLLFGFIEFILLRLTGMFRLGALTRVTYYEALLQPFALVLLVAGTAAIIILAFFPFFTISEDHKMYRDVAVSLVFLFSLPVMIFSSTKVVDEEIENKTMLTLMSKPIARWQVIIGKYLGVILVCFAFVAALGMVTAICSYIRFYDDMRLDYMTAADGGDALNFAHFQSEIALIPALLLQFLQLATLAAVSVAVSTRFGLAVNITAVICLYVLANLARYSGTYNLPQPLSGIAFILTHVLPGLGYLDLSQRLIYGQFNYGGESSKFFIPGIPSYADIWAYTALAGVYALLYIASTLSFGIAAFRTRELS